MPKDDEKSLKQKRSQVRILYLEDEAETRRTNTAMLRRHFGEVVSASRGDEALEILYRYHPHVILSEVMLRDGNLRNFIKELKERSGNAAFVIYTATPGIAPREGFRGVILKKPASNDSLIYAIERILFD